MILGEICFYSLDTRSKNWRRSLNLNIATIEKPVNYWFRTKIWFLSDDKVGLKWNKSLSSPAGNDNPLQVVGSLGANPAGIYLLKVCNRNTCFEHISQRLSINSEHVITG